MLASQTIQLSVGVLMSLLMSGLIKRFFHNHPHPEFPSLRFSSSPAAAQLRPIRPRNRGGEARHRHSVLFLPSQASLRLLHRVR
jgi:hypothetical protein